MEVISKVAELQERIKRWKQAGLTIGFVPTMGYLHEGHLSLVREAKKRNDRAAVSIFVNPKQFGPAEDYNVYPRDFNRDAALLEKEGVDLIFYPAVEEMYPAGYKTYVEVEDLENRLCGRSRPGHFRGVCTVVLKLFNLIQPDEAYFGWKDAQQVIILKKMVEDLNLPVKIRPMPLIREKDGLALSSRNIYLNPQERQASVVLYRSLELAEEIIKNGERQAARIRQQMVNLISAEPLARIDYVEIVDPQTLEPLVTIDGDALVAVAVYFGRTRLIDNLRFISGVIEK
ncbi:MAG TPA: pantoate--beta-alanine ligase [Candidatus Saccharicenans sp.]|nr:pantoate--beta-alanine ligase [Candidatus Saccharicenans sp.]HQO75688.1 pantoate--beta-alanine ligase [Candidatus Saccharicenans sp.]HUM79270.1 pantoate--beta-alanine ligase [Candidatus Saccharicenans sp.]